MQSAATGGGLWRTERCMWKVSCNVKVRRKMNELKDSKSWCWSKMTPRVSADVLVLLASGLMYWLTFSVFSQISNGHKTVIDVVFLLRGVHRHTATTWFFPQQGSEVLKIRRQCKAVLIKRGNFYPVWEAVLWLLRGVSCHLYDMNWHETWSAEAATC